MSDMKVTISSRTSPDVVTPEPNPSPNLKDSATSLSAKKPLGPWGMLWRKFSRNPYAMTGFVVLLIFILAAVFAPWITKYDPAKIDMMFPNLKAGAEGHLLGTDELGRDVFARLLYSARISLLIGFSVALASVVVGSIIGAISGYFGGWVDTVFMRIVDVMNSVPTLFLNILVLAIFGSEIKYMILILAFTSWMSIARLVRGNFLQLREMQYVEAARAIGVSNTGIIFRHLLRNSTFPIIVNATLMVGAAILSESALSYLGLGIQPPATSWGLMLSNAQEFMLVDKMQAVYPGLCILIVVLAVNFIGDGIRDALDPRQNLNKSRRRLAKWRRNFSKSEN
ncbi:ABC transporter permease [Paenibacillus sp. DXFW5]|jgi:peptide/nickel transport system permease protein|uniref:ABC transporter permease n=1 Tax=Paenibacillus rhizolycopersici TaxID=2780073 RepID=A0ABS2H4T0_9BACL|nr:MULTISPECIES: ABC transporter permease [Paenibacillus]MBM6996475.1 ABC transporter permease [Paenibacillus rhizolycopersici]GIP47972.1 oligopeptide transport system permease protein AppC [Paenibacillus sp. J53TS2]